MGYDGAGNLTSDGSQTFTYDATGQQATASGTGLTQSYDGTGLRLRKTENGVTTYYVRSSVLGGQVVAELNGSGSVQRGYVYSGTQLLAIQSGGAVQWVHQEPYSKGQRITNTSGNVVSTIELDPWGGDTSRSSNQAFQPHRFTTYERDANGGDDAMMRRYQGGQRRFAQPDPYDGSFNPSEPQTFNRYSYVKNDPINLADPSGLGPDLGNVGNVDITDEDPAEAFMSFARTSGSIRYRPNVPLLDDRSPRGVRLQAFAQPQAQTQRTPQQKFDDCFNEKKADVDGEYWDQVKNALAGAGAVFVAGTSASAMLASYEAATVVGAPFSLPTFGVGIAITALLDSINLASQINGFQITRDRETKKAKKECTIQAGL